METGIDVDLNGWKDAQARTMDGRTENAAGFPADNIHYIQVVKPLWPFMIASALTFAGVYKLQNIAVNSAFYLSIRPLDAPFFALHVYMVKSMIIVIVISDWGKCNAAPIDMAGV